RITGLPARRVGSVALRKRTGKSACATEQQNQKRIQRSRRDAGVTQQQQCHEGAARPAPVFAYSTARSDNAPDPSFHSRRAYGIASSTRVLPPRWRASSIPASARFIHSVTRSSVSSPGREVD